MKDIYRELLRRSLEDTASVVETVEAERDVEVQDIGPMAIQLYQFRVMQSDREWARAKNRDQYPDNHRGTQ